MKFFALLLLTISVSSLYASPSCLLVDEQTEYNDILSELEEAKKENPDCDQNPRMNECISPFKETILKFYKIKLQECANPLLKDPLYVKAIQMLASGECPTFTKKEMPSWKLPKTFMHPFSERDAFMEGMRSAIQNITDGTVNLSVISKPDDRLLCRCMSTTYGSIQGDGFKFEFSFNPGIVQPFTCLLENR